MRRVTPTLFVAFLAGCSSFGSATSSPPLDASAPDAPSAAGALPCDSPHLACQDFDHGEDLSPWTISPGGAPTSTASVSTDGHASGAKSLRVETANGDFPGPSIDVGLGSPAPSHVKCSFALRIDEATATEPVTVFELVMADQNGRFALLLHPNGSLEIEQNRDNASQTGTLVGGVQQGGFTNVAFEVDYRQGGRVVATVGSFPTSIDLQIGTSTAGLAGARFGLLARGTNGSGAFTIYLDNLVCDALP